MLETAIPETMRSGGILVHTKNYNYIAELMNCIQNNNILQNRILKTQESSLNYYENFPFRDTIYSMLNDKNYYKKLAYEKS
jgi:hypothetical protein